MGIEKAVADDGSIGIVNVYEGSPAASAGLVPGDRIVSVNSRPVSELGVDGVRDQLRRPPGTKVTLGFRRADAVKQVELELKQIL